MSVGCPVFFLLVCRSSLYILDINPLLDVGVPNIFSQYIAHLLGLSVAVGLRLELHQNLLQSLLKQTVESHARVSDSVEQRWGPRICISNKYSSESDGPGTTR